MPSLKAKDIDQIFAAKLRKICNLCKNLLKNTKFFP